MSSNLRNSILNEIFTVRTIHVVWNLSRPRDWYLLRSFKWGNTNVLAYASLWPSWCPAVKHNNTSRGQVHFISLANPHIWSLGLLQMRCSPMILPICGLKMVNTGYTGLWFLSCLIRVPSPWPSHWFEAYVIQGQSMSCKTEMVPGVYLIYGAKSNVQHMCQELGSVIYLCCSFPDARNWKPSETELLLLIFEI